MLFSLPYCLAFIFVLSLYYIPQQSGIVTVRYFPVLAIFTFLLIFIGFRGFIVTDWGIYYPYFEYRVPTLCCNTDEIKSFINTWPWEKGFLVYSIIMKTLFPNYFLFQFFSFLFDLIIIHITFVRYIPRKYFPIAYAVFFVFQGFVIEVNLLRNSKAIMLFLLSIPYLQDRKFFKYVLLNILGSMFHISGLLYIPLYFILNKEFNKKYILLFFVLGNIFFFSKIKVVSTLLVFIAPFFEGTRFASLISAYGLISEDFSSYSIGIGFIERTFTFFLVLYFQNQIITKNKNLCIFINLLYVYFFCYLYLAEVKILIERMTLLFVAGYWISFPIIYEKLSKNRKIYFVLFLFIYGILKMMVQCDEPIYSYTNVLFEEQVYSQRYDLFNHEGKK